MRLPDSENFLVGDFNTYCMNVAAGTLSYVLAGNEEKNPQRQIELLQLAFNVVTCSHMRSLLLI